MTSYNKLVRDRIPEILDQKGIPYELRVASDEEFHIELIKKLVEEAAEFAEARTPEELGDVIEVVEALKKLPAYREAERIRLQKLTERGGFKKKFILKGEKEDKPL